MDKYLYLLPFKNNKHFKIGISTNNFNRINLHNSTYNINLNNAYIVTSKFNKIIPALETELLCSIPESKTINEFKNLDGYTEIRDINHFNKALEIIGSKDDNLKIKIEKYNSLNNKIKNKRKPIHPKYPIKNNINNTYEIDEVSFLNSFEKFKIKFEEFKSNIISLKKNR